MEMTKENSYSSCFVVVRSHEPSLTQNVTAAPITTISPHLVSSKCDKELVRVSYSNIPRLEVLNTC